MVFSSTTFLFLFLPIVLFGYFVLFGFLKKGRKYFLLLLSLIFFAWSQLDYLWIILASIFINYMGGVLVDSFDKKKVFLILSILLNLSLLIYFKYWNFIIEIFNAVSGANVVIDKIILPIGISFFTFQGMSYVIDVYRKDVEVQKNIFKLALYITFFPQLIAGPIVRYKDVAYDIENNNPNVDDFFYGIERFILGLAKKVLLANTLAVVVDNIWAKGAGNHTLVIAWVGSIAYALQIYYDFSGYSDMAIGLGRMFGFHFNENFNLPYISRSITEFWRRWHISLSSWFRDYVYIPLGGSRKHVYINLLIVFLLTGIWHGASYTFIVWGLFNALFIIVERFILRNKDRKEPNIIKSILLRVYALLVINIGWIIFRAPTLDDAWRYLKNMVGICDNPVPNLYIDNEQIFILIVGILFTTKLPTIIYNRLKNRSKTISILYFVILIILFIIAVARVTSGSYNPFIYFRF